MNLRTLSADPSPFVRIEILVSTGLGHQEMGDMAVAQGELYHDLLVSEGSPLVRKDIVLGVTHAGDTGLYNSREGTNLIRDVLINECRPQMP